MGNVKENFKRSCLNGGMIAAVVIPLALFAESLYEGGLLQKTDVDILSAYALPMALSNYLQFACLFPILPFALSYCEDKNSGYLKYILQRQGRKNISETGFSGAEYPEELRQRCRARFYFCSFSVRHILPVESRTICIIHRTLNK